MCSVVRAAFFRLALLASGANRDPSGRVDDADADADDIDDDDDDGDGDGVMLGSLSWVTARETCSPRPEYSSQKSSRHGRR